MSRESSEVLLKNFESARIYNDFCRDLPIVDYHCHLKPDEIYKDVRYENLTQLWLAKDHYKWRLMRANGIEEERITGCASDQEKFYAWAETIQRCIGNPVYQWTQMELERFFGITTILTRETAPMIWQKASEMLQKDEMSARGLIDASRVLLIGTTDDPRSDLKWHRLLAEDPNFSTRVIPTMRVDSLLRVEDSEIFEVIESDGKINCRTLSEYLCWIETRIAYFDDQGCRSVDLGIGAVLFREVVSDPKATFVKLRQKDAKVSAIELADLKTTLVMEIIKRIAEKGWVFQLHFGALPSVNQEARRRLGTGTGFDTIADQGSVAEGLLFLFNRLNNQGCLPKTVLYNIDGNKNQVSESILAAFQANEEGIKGKMQHGPAWWFQDTLQGNRRQLEDFAEQGILMNFIGMTTDSRSFLSYARHDYFRRILCDLLSEWIEAGLMPKDDRLIKEFLEAVCWKNAADYFSRPGDSELTLSAGN